jgi:hypothetical protein
MALNKITTFGAFTGTALLQAVKRDRERGRTIPRRG